MGQNQSAGTREGSSSTGNNEDSRTDYYQLLGLDRGASAEDIKKAYRKKALELHPDRNYGNVEDATKLFAEVQVAYEVLSDPQERAWYDSHRDAILRNDDTSSRDQYSYNIRMTTADDIMKLFHKFSPRMDFSDSPSGFFGGLRETFEQIAREEELACQWDNLEPVYYPSFGSRDDDFDDVVRPFYAAWSGFATKKSFAWRDVYRCADAPDRRVRRLMEKENKRLRDEGIREFNDAVRSLVAFVKKRDPRYIANAESEAQRQQKLRSSAAAQAARSRAANEAKLRDHVIPEWAKAEEPEEEFSSDSDSEQEHFECVICRKTFKSEKQYEAHERSKKHIKAVKQLRWEMRAQDKELELETIQNTETDSRKGNMPLSSELDNSLTSESPLQNEGDLPEGDFDTGNDNGPSLTMASQDEGHMPKTEDDTDNRSLSGAVEEGGDSEILRDKQQTEDLLETFSQKLSVSTSSESPSTMHPKIGKAKQRRAKKAAQKATEEQSRLTCVTCNASFPSRTQLFSHIRDLNHAQPVSKPTRTVGRSKG
ncbi:hypothetical protein VTN02DRAFT_1989 [Thermoascus thermophilus]